MQSKIQRKTIKKTNLKEQGRKVIVDGEFMTEPRGRTIQMLMRQGDKGSEVVNACIQREREREV